VRAARKLSQPDDELAEIDRAFAKIEALDKKIAKVTAMLPDGPERPLLAQIEKWEVEREKTRASLIHNEAQMRHARAMASVTEKDVLHILDNMANDMASLEPEELRDFLRGRIEKIVMDQQTLNSRIHYQIPSLSGDRLASHGGFEPRLPL
jgi:hypothetical protein